MTTKLLRCIAAIALFGVASAGSSLLAQTSSQNPALGLVAKTTGGMIGNAPANEGSSVFSGDYLSTQENGSLLVRIGALSMELQGSSSAHIYRAPYGAIVELNRGSVVYSTPGTHENLVVVASDVRVTPTLAVADFGRVTIDDPCNVTVTSQRGNANVQAGSESHFVEQGKAYRVRAENEVSYHQYLSPDDGDYHRYHEHRPCAPVQMVKGRAPIAPGQSRFLLVSAALVTGVAVFGISEALESPHRP